MLINATLPEEDRVAIVDDGVLTELDIEIAGRQQTKSNIYLGEVIRVEQGLQAAFVDYGAARPGFLQIGEIHPSLYPLQEDGSPTTKRLPINQILKRGQHILVQVVKEERGNKGAALTTEISLPGRYMVLMPESTSRGISRKIENESIRKGIKQAIAGLELPDNMGYIIRTAAIDQPPEELKRDFDYLLSTYNSIISHSKEAKAPALIYQESNLVIRSIRDYFSPEIDEVLIDDRKVFQEARDFFKAVMPEYVSLVKLHQERRPIFARYQIEEQIAQLSSNIVNLPSGGSIVLDQTEALVAIDVNSGKMSSEQDVEATAYRVNLEAATEVARQLRLRDMGGLIVIDFIDMRQRKNAREVEKALKTGLKIDKARVTVGRISHQFGLLEMSRQRIKGNLGEGTYHQCPHCQGNGRIKGAESRSVALLRRIQAGTAKGNIDIVNCTAAVDVANYILNNKRLELLDLEQRYSLKIIINADQNYFPEQTELEFIKQNKELANGSNAQTPLVDMDVSERGHNQAVDTPEDEEIIENTAEELPKADTDNRSEEPATVEKKRPRRRRRPNRRRNDSASDEQHSPVGITIEASPEQQLLNSAPNVVLNEKTAPDSNNIDQAAATTESGAIPVEVKKPAKRRRATRKKETTTDNAQPVTEAEKSPEQLAVTTAETEKSSAVIAPSENTDTSAASVQEVTIKQQADTADDAEQSKAIKKPVRRRRATKKAIATTEPSIATSEHLEPTDTAKTSEEAAASSPTSKKRVNTPKTEKTHDSSETTPEDPIAMPAKKTPRRRSTAKKVVAPTAVEAAAPTEKPGEAVAVKDSVDKEKMEKKPVRRRRTTKKAEQSITTEPDA